MPQPFVKGLTADMRNAYVKRTTKETDIDARINLDGSGAAKISTGIGFFDHMLTALANHSLMDIELTCKGDLNVDGHHSVEDCGIALGMAFAEAIGDKRGIKRMGSAFVPMDEALAHAALDISGRPWLCWNVPEQRGIIGAYDAELTEEFMRAFAINAGITLHMRLLYGVNSHHVAEALYKSLARALREAVSIDERVKGVPSTKGVL